MDTVNSRNNLLKITSVLILGLTLAACGGRGDPRGTDTVDDTTTPTTPTDSTLRLGSGSGSSFAEGEIAAGDDTLSAGGTTSLTVSLVDSSGDLSTSSGTVEFSSVCIASGDSTITPTGSITLSGGKASTTYAASGCIGEDLVTATALVGGKSYTAQKTVSVAADTSRFIGSGTGDDFLEGAIGIGIGTATLSAGGSTQLTVNFVDAQGDLATDDFDVSFVSRCLSANEATLPAESFSTSIGQVTTTYTAAGCVGADEVTARASYNGSVLEAIGTINVASDAVQSLAFVDATPTQISLKGTGGQETSVVRFRVLGSSGAPIKNKCVNFTLNTSVGGLALVNNKCETTDVAAGAKTDSSGYASATVQAGTVASTVTVTATEQESGISTQSNSLRVSTGIPDQKGMSLSATSFNPSAWGYDGVTVDFTIRLADLFSNPPANGTVVSFTTSGGSIQSSCTTTDGVCSVTWTSQQPKPLLALSPLDTSKIVPALPQGTDPFDIFPSETLHKAGRITILAHTNGNEYFKDLNGNFQYDVTDGFSINAAEDYTDANSNGVYDAAEIFADNNTNGRYDEGEEFTDEGNGYYDVGELYFDSNLNGTRDAGEDYIDVGNGDYDAVAETFADEDGDGAVDANEYEDLNDNDTYDAHIESYVDGGNGVYDAAEVTSDLDGDNVCDGAEPFADANSNGQYDGGETFTDTNSNGVYNIGEPFNDMDADGVRDAAESFTDSNDNGAYDPAEEYADLGSDELPCNGIEAYTDSNANGKYDVGEAFVDADADGTYDAISELFVDVDTDGVKDEREYFEDKNGNGTWDDAEVYEDANFDGEYNASSCLRNAPQSTATNSANACDDLGEAYRDDFFNHIFDLFDEESNVGDTFFVDFDLDGGYSSNDGKYNGVLCSTQAKAAGRCSSEGVTIRKELEIAMSSQEPYTINGRLPGQPVDVERLLDDVGDTITLTLADENQNALPAGTVVTIKTTNAENVKVSNTTKTIGNGSPNSDTFSFTVTPSDPEDVSSGSILIDVVAPGINNATETTTFTMPITYDPTQRRD